MARQALSDPGPFLAYTHGDPWSSDWLMTAKGAKLVDFENGDYRHALIDLVHPRMGFPTQPYAGVQALPRSSLVLIEQAYHAELSKGWSEGSDQQRFQQEIVHACTYWALMSCRFRSIPRFTANPALVNLIGLDRTLVHFEAFTRTTVEFRYLEALGNLFQEMVQVLRPMASRAQQALEERRRSEEALQSSHDMWRS